MEVEMMDEKYKKFVSDGNSVTEFKIVRTIKDLESDTNSLVSFHPEFSHQIYSEEENIFGYEGLKVKIYVAAGSLKSHVDISYDKKISPEKFDGLEADDILEKLQKVLPTPPNYISNMNEFTIELAQNEPSFRPIGELVHSFQKILEPPVKQKKIQNGEAAASVHCNLNGANGVTAGPVATPTESTFEIYTCDISTPKFGDYLPRIELFLLWFIDAANFVDPDDEKWKFFVMYEKYKNRDGGLSYAFVGYATVYNNYVYPEHIRPKISQVLILPPWQRQGLGVQLLTAIYNRYRPDPKVVDITVEDPSDEFEALRDYVDTQSCLQLPSFASTDKISSGFSKEMEEEAKKALKMTKMQARRVYEIVRLRSTNEENEDEFKSYRLDVKSRLNIPFKRQEAEIRRLMKYNVATAELKKAELMADATRKDRLESDFQMLMGHYRKILARLEKYGHGQ